MAVCKMLLVLGACSALCAVASVSQEAPCADGTCRPEDGGAPPSVHDEEDNSGLFQTNKWFWAGDKPRRKERWEMDKGMTEAGMLLVHKASAYCDHIAQMSNDGAEKLIITLKEVVKSMTYNPDDKNATSLLQNVVKNDLEKLNWWFSEDDEEIDFDQSEDPRKNAAAVYCAKMGTKLGSFMREVASLMQSLSKPEAALVMAKAAERKASLELRRTDEQAVKQHRREEPFVQLDGVKPTPVRRVQTPGFTQEMLIKYPKVEGMKFTESTVRVPFKKMFEAEFSRDNHAMGQRDYGILKQFWGPNNMPSAMSNKVYWGISEKMHTLHYEGKVNSATADAMVRNRTKWWTPLHDKFAKMPSIRYLKTFATAMFAKTLIEQMHYSGGQYQNLHNVRDYAEANEYEIEPRISKKIRDYQDVFSKRLGAYRASKGNESVKVEEDVTTVRSEIVCNHFEQIPGLIIEKDDTGVVLPLNKKIVVFRGRLAFAPNEEWGLANGIAVFSHNKATNRLEVWYGFSSEYDTVDAEPEMRSNFFVGPADGADGVVAPDTRESPAAFHPGIASVYQIAAELPTDFSFIYNYRSNVGCPDSALKTFEANAVRIANLHDPHMKNVNSLIHFLENMPCTVEYLRPDHYHSSGLQRFETIGFMHMMSETTPDFVSPSLAAHVSWNSIKGKELY